LKSKQIVILSLLTSLASVVYFLESFVPLPVPIPGLKWGFSNAVVLMVLGLFGPKNAIIVTVCKGLLGSLLAGRLFSPAFFLGTVGGVGGASTMALLFRANRFGLVGISLGGALVNNLLQLTLAATWLLGNQGVFLLTPLVVLMGSFSAIANAFLARGGLRWLNKVPTR